MTDLLCGLPYTAKEGENVDLRTVVIATLSILYLFVLFYPTQLQEEKFSYLEINGVERIEIRAVNVRLKAGAAQEGISCSGMCQTTLKGALLEINGTSCIVSLGSDVYGKEIAISAANIKASGRFSGNLFVKATAAEFDDFMLLNPSHIEISAAAVSGTLIAKKWKEGKITVSVQSPNSKLVTKRSDISEDDLIVEGPATVQNF